MSAWPLALLWLLAACVEPVEVNDTCSTHVGKKAVLIDNADFLLLTPGDSGQLTASVHPITKAEFTLPSGLDLSNCRFEYGAPVTSTFVWRTQDASVATIRSNGWVVGVAAGSTIVSAASQEHGGSALREVIVRP